MERIFSDFFNDDLIQKAEILDIKGDEKTVLITGLEYDSRTIKPGSMYFALPGIHTDGHSYINSAIKNGAAAIVYQNDLSEYVDGILYIKAKDSRFAMSSISDAFYDSPSKKLAVIGVTGTEGKSTTVYLIFQLLRLAGKKAGFFSTVQYCTDDKVEWNPEHQTTPEATVVHKHLYEMQKNGLEYAVVESSSHGLSSKTNRLGNVAFDVGVMCNVTHEHLEFHGTWEQYRLDKAALFRSFDTYNHEKNICGGQTTIPSFGVVNADDKSADFFAESTKQSVYSFSTKGNDADISIKFISSGADGNRYEVLVKSKNKLITINDRLPGEFNAGNVLAALLTVSHILSVSIEELIPYVIELKPVRGRMWVVDKGQPFEVLVDYAHTPSSFETVFPPLRERLNKSGGRIISLFGSGGERDTKKRPEQGRIAAQYSDIVFISDEDPRGEIPMAICEDIAKGCLAAQGCKNLTLGENLFLIPDRPTAIRKAFSMAQPGDLVILLGKGHENSIIYADKTIPYDEIEEAEKALAEQCIIHN
jgi:UDP-N-acetylmuramoyl-L-alanyl-D-glutamate--2,6-diaminopimelate ligase